MICTTLPILPAPLAPFVVDIFSPLLSQLVNNVTSSPSRLVAGFRLRIWDDNCLLEASSRNWSLHSVADDFLIAQLASHHFISFSKRQERSQMLTATIRTGHRKLSKRSLIFVSLAKILKRLRTLGAQSSARNARPHEPSGDAFLSVVRADH